MPNINSGPIRAIIVTPSDLLGRALQGVLCDAHHQALHLSTLTELRILSKQQTQLLFLDDRALGQGGWRRPFNQVRNWYPDSKVVLLSASCEPLWVWQAMQHHVDGYLYLLDKLATRLPLIVQDVCDGGVYLSPTAQTALDTVRFYRSQPLTEYQRGILRLMVRCQNAPQIAQELNRSTAAIYQMQRHLRLVFDAENNAELVQTVTALRVLDDTTAILPVS